MAGPPPILLETERMILRQFSPADADDLVELDADPEVRRYVHSPTAPSRGQVMNQTLPRWQACYNRYGHFGYWAAVEKSSGDFLGWFHFLPSTEDPQEIALGYRLRLSAWGRGYATEGSRALIHKGFAELGVRKVVATALEANAASIRVMTKAGMRLEKRFLYEGLPAVKYSIAREEYLAGLQL